MHGPSTRDSPRSVGQEPQSRRRSESTAKITSNQRKSSPFGHDRAVAEGDVVNHQIAKAQSLEGGYVFSDQVFQGLVPDITAQDIEPYVQDSNPRHLSTAGRSDPLALEYARSSLSDTMSEAMMTEETGNSQVSYAGVINMSNELQGLQIFKKNHYQPQI